MEAALVNAISKADMSYLPFIFYLKVKKKYLLQSSRQGSSKSFTHFSFLLHFWNFPLAPEAPSGGCVH